jgi:hypothetical protein
MARFRRLGLAAFIGGLLLAHAAGAETRPVVVELFTSQGCSSCPPADRLLGELATRANVIALGFHIDYWDRLGWKDPLSTSAATDRQRIYAHRFNAGQIYTPQMVVDGTREMIGSGRTAVLAALSEAHPVASAPILFAPDRRSVTVGAGAGKGTVFLVRFARHRTTQIGNGENKGRTTDDFNGVEELHRLGEWSGASQDFAISPPLAGEGLAVLVQAPNGAILGAASDLAAAAGPAPGPV